MGIDILNYQVYILHIYIKIMREMLTLESRIIIDLYSWVRILIYNDVGTDLIVPRRLCAGLPFKTRTSNLPERIFDIPISASTSKKQDQARTQRKEERSNFMSSFLPILFSND